MSIFSWISDVLGGASEQAQNLSEGVQDKAAELDGQAEGLGQNLGDQAQSVVDILKDKLP